MPWSLIGCVGRHDTALGSSAWLLVERDSRHSRKSRRYSRHTDFPTCAIRQPTPASRPQHVEGALIGDCHQRLQLAVILDQLEVLDHMVLISMRRAVIDPGF